MKKILIYILLIITSTIINAQQSQFPFSTRVLSRFLALSKSDIKPKCENDKFYYFENNIKIFAAGFNVAYPFVGKSALVKNKGKYGIIDLKGNYLVKPIYNNFTLPSYDTNLVIFTEDYIFDLQTGKQDHNGYIYCAEPAIPNFSKFKNKKGKYGIYKHKWNKKTVLIKPKYDEILDIYFQYFVVKLKEKIGVISPQDSIIMPFIYDDFIVSRGDYYRSPQTIGLKKNQVWYYQSISENTNKKIVESSYKIYNTNNIALKNALGIFKINNQVNILFVNGKTLKSNYKKLSFNGLIGIKNGHVYYLNPDGSDSLYY